MSLCGIINELNIKHTIQNVNQGCRKQVEDGGTHCSEGHFTTQPFLAWI